MQSNILPRSSKALLYSLQFLIFLVDFFVILVENGIIGLSNVCVFHITTITLLFFVCLIWNYETTPEATPIYITIE